MLAWAQRCVCAPTSSPPMMARSPALTSPNSDGGHILSIAGGRYFVPPSKPGNVQRVPWTDDFGLVSVLTIPRYEDEKPHITANWLRTIVGEYEKGDDVFDREFLTTVIFHGAQEREITLTNEAREYLGKLGNEYIVFDTTPGLLPGPYVLVGNELRDVWKLVTDSNGTCMVTLKPNLIPSEAFESFQWMDSSDQFPTFALQSRIKARATFNSPLAGLRLVVKDNIDVQGIKTSVGNRAFSNTFPPLSETATCIQNLLDQGMLLVGKTKMNSFGNWEEPIEYIDYQAPWNPRADRYQSPGGSSSGSAAAIATYDWLDIAIGTDTWASVTRPALWCGCFALRPSTGAVPQHGIEPFCRKWDTAGVLSRNLKRCRDFAAVWLDAKALQADVKPFSSVIWPEDFWSIVDPDQIEKAHEFAETVGSTLGIDCEKVSFEEIWLKSPPAEAKGGSLLDFISDAMGAQCYDAYHNLQGFISEHHEKFNHAPYVSPSNKKMWSFAKDITKEQRDRGFAKIDIYEKWFNEAILTGKHSNALIIMPLESMTPRYRDESPSFKRPPQGGINALALAPVLKSPLLAIPIDEIPYHSKITGQEEKLPFVVSVMGKPGTDLTLMDTIHRVLEGSKLPTSVKTGKVMFG